MSDLQSKKTVTCGQCKGLKQVDGKTCPKCGGEGVIVERVSESGLARQTRVLNE